jgi:hypothetical protein
MSRASAPCVTVRSNQRSVLSRTFERGNSPCSVTVGAVISAVTGRSYRLSSRWVASRSPIVAVGVGKRATKDADELLELREGEEEGGGDDGIMLSVGEEDGDVDEDEREDGIGEEVVSTTLSRNLSV